MTTRYPVAYTRAPKLLPRLPLPCFWVGPKGHFATAPADLPQTPAVVVPCRQ